MMKARFVVRAPWICSAVLVTSTLVACGKSSGKFDGETAPWGPKTATTQMDSVVTVSGGGLLPAITVAQHTEVVGQKTINGQSYDRLATTRVDDPSKGGEYWIKENPDGTLDFAGFQHSDLLSGLLPPSSTAFTAPVKVNLDPPVGQPQPVTTTGTVTVPGAATPSTANFNGQYSLVEKNATVATGVGKISGCSHYSGSATTDSPEIPAALKQAQVSAELWYHPSYGVVAFTAPSLGVGTSMTGVNDCGQIDSSGYRIIRKVGTVDASTAFDLDTYECDGNQFAADKNTHASMLLELRWVDDATAKTAVMPAPTVEFGTPMGVFPSTLTSSPTSVFHPEENGQGFTYWYGYVNQAAKNEIGDSTAYHITVSKLTGTAAVRVTGRIYYKVLPALVGTTKPDAAPVGGNRDSGIDGPAGGNPDSGIDGPAGGGGMDGSSTVTCNSVLFDNGNIAACTNPTDTSVFTLSSASTVTSLRLWVNTNLSGQTVTYTLLGPTGSVLSSGPTTKGGCDTYQTNWCEFLVSMNMSLPAGTYTVKSSAVATCSNSGSNNVGMVAVKGCTGSSPPADAGSTEAGTAAGTGCNLIVNGNAESAVGSTDGNPVPTPGWTSAGEATAGQYGAPFGYPGPADPGPDDRGNNLFAGGVADAVSTLTQTVSLSQYGSAIDAGGVSYLLSGWLGGWDGQDDNAVLTVTFKSAANVDLGTAGSIGPVLSSDRSGISGLLFRSTSGAVPAGTRTAVVVLTLTRTSGTNNDAYADNLSLALSGAGIPASTCNPSPVGDGGVGVDASKDAPVGAGGSDGGGDVSLGTGGAGGTGGTGGITGTGGLLTVPSGTPTITEEFDTLPTTTTQFVPIQAAGGDFTKFATVSGSRLVVDVPAGNSWGKTGVRSKDPVFQVTDDMAQSPWSVLVELDTTASTGLAVVLSPSAYDDIWTAQNFWWAWIRHPTAGGTSTNIANTQNTGDTAKSLTNTPLIPPGTLAVVSRPGQVQACTSGGWGMEGSYAWMTAGTQVYAYVFSHAYDSGMPVKLAVKSIKVVRGAACGAAGSIPAYTAVPEKAVFADDLSGGIAQNWTPIQAAGGDYTKFATTPAGELYVNVPAGNSWGKTGLRSSYFMFDVRDDMATTPLSLAFDFVPARTSGFALALSPTAYDDIWTSQNFWAAFVRHPTAAGASTNIANTQNTGDTAKSIPNIPSDAPSTVTLAVRPGHVQMCTSTGWGMEGDYAWMTTGTKVYAYVFSHAYDSGMPVQMDLTNMHADRTAACGASGSIPAYPAPAPRVLFQDAFAGGYAQNWVGIQAAGGDFSKFAVNTTNEVYVNVPANNSWGKTGIRSNYYLFDVRSDYATSPMTLDFAFDATRTSGFVIALSSTAYDDIWTSQNVWMAFIIDPDTGLAEFDLANTQNTSDTSLSKPGLSAAIPAKVSLTITPGHVKAALSNGQVLEGDYAWLTVGTPVYAYAFSHPIREGLPSSMALKSVTATR